MSHSHHVTGMPRCLTKPIVSFKPAYERIVLKLSGESFCRERAGGISMTAVGHISRQIKEVAASGVQVAIVCGGGNILRGKEFAAVSEAIAPSTAHYMGMLATVINGLALQDALENDGVPTRLLSAIRMEGVAEPFIRRRCVRHLGEGPRRDSRRRHRQSVRHDRHGRRPPFTRDRSRYSPQSHEGGRHLFRRSGEEPACRSLFVDHLPGRACRRTCR